MDRKCLCDWWWPFPGLNQTDAYDDDKEFVEDDQGGSQVQVHWAVGELVGGWSSRWSSRWLPPTHTTPSPTPIYCTSFGWMCVQCTFRWSLRRGWIATVLLRNNFDILIQLLNEFLFLLKIQFLFCQSIAIQKARQNNKEELPFLWILPNKESVAISMFTVLGSCQHFNWQLPTTLKK